jgi:hypothetical protein
MPAATAPGLILDRFGNPVGPRGQIYPRKERDDELRAPAPNLFNDFNALLAPREYVRLVSYCRDQASKGLAEALLESKCDYLASSGYAPTFTGTDEAYGADLLAALLPALNTGNLRGLSPEFNWRSTARLGPMRRATDGSYFILLTQWPETGMPAYQVFEGHRIWQRDPGKRVIDSRDTAFTIDAEGGRRKTLYIGCNINQGVITTPLGTVVAYRILGADPDGTEDQDISARDLIHVAALKRDSQSRPPPQMAGSVEDLIALHLASQAQLDQQIIDARQTVVESNATGKAPYDAYNGGDAAQPPVATQVYERAGVKFVKSGHEAKPWQTQRPSDQWMNFDMRIASRAAAALRWRVEMLFPEKIGAGAAQRGYQDQINTLVRAEFAIDAPALQRVVQYFAAKIIKMGIVSNHEEARELEIAEMAEYEVDRGSRKIDIEDVAAGRTSMSDLHRRDATTSRRIYTDRARAYKEALAIAKAEKVPLEIIYGDQGLTAARSGYYPANDPTPDPTAPQPKETEQGGAGSQETKKQSQP